ncbi:MAG TPA: hypothetical protein VNL71_10360, partial [Chloroflexota bacterium]|nr:hypothetical protein [Chloroflexota bacterium]
MGARAIHLNHEPGLARVEIGDVRANLMLLSERDPTPADPTPADPTPTLPASGEGDWSPPAPCAASGDRESVPCFGDPIPAIPAAVADDPTPTLPASGE